MSKIEINDLVKVIFSDGHTTEGIVREVNPFQDFGFKVEIKVFGKECFIYCNEKDLIKVEKEAL